MTKSISGKLFTLLLLLFLFLFQACTTDDDNTTLPENKYLTGITTERRFTKAEVIIVLNTISPVDISKTHWR